MISAWQLHYQDFKSEMLLIYLARIQYSVFSVRLRIPCQSSSFVVVTKAGSNFCKLPLKSPTIRRFPSGQHVFTFVPDWLWHKFCLTHKYIAACYGAVTCI